MKRLVGWVWNELGKKIYCDTLRRILKAAGYVWRRMRKSQRDEGLFVFFQQKLKYLKQMD